jgi:hypothetical protein
VDDVVAELGPALDIGLERFRYLGEDDGLHLRKDRRPL